MTLTWASIRRRGWIVPVCVVIVVGLAIAVGRSRLDYFQSDAVVAVPAANNNAAGTPPVTLAATYANLIPQDTGIAMAVARAVGLPASTVRARIAARQVPATSIIDLTYNGPTAGEATAGMAALIATLANSNRIAHVVPAGALQLVSGPSSAKEVTSHVPGGPVPIGLVVGLILGIAAFVAWERFDARADTQAILSAELGLPVTVADGELQTEHMIAVVQRWLQLGGDAPDQLVALVAATVPATSAAASLASRFALLRDVGHVTFNATGPPGTAAGGDLAAIRSNVVVLTVVAGDRINDVRRTARTLAELGVSPRWGILAVDRE